ncbi:ATP-binding protein [Neolewinella agarilytica]|uniref:ATP-binding protein n=1 Tax=Neolewinella agarilytica TaxID=478744 RepID=UPI0023544BE7|nr:ATP-binding protein [Neolewinella agarilytica]
MPVQPKPRDLLQQLRDFPHFEGIEDPALQWLIERGEYHILPKDDYLFRSNEEINTMQILLRGGYVIRREKDGKKQEMGVWEAPYVSGVLPFSRMTRITAEAKVIEELHFLEIHKNCFTEMVNVSYLLVQRLVSIMTERVRDYQQIQLMNEKLLALGKMSAGLAHELNNPASAMVRSSQELQRHMTNTPEKFKATITMRINPDDVDVVNDILFERLTARVDTQELSLMEREERTDDLTDWLADRGITNVEELTDTFVDWDFRPEHLDSIAEVIPQESLGPVLSWVETNLTTESLVEEISTASKRIAELVSSIKTYSHMDSDPSMEFIDVNDGIKSTLTMLKFRFKQKNVELDKTCDLNLPSIKALEGELNQVWTNLISNALDALPDDGTGKLTIRSYQRRDNLCIDFEDNGPGIPEDIRNRIFEPFFTTKGIGEGTGMGLDIVRRVLLRHGGTVALESSPGKTCFRVCFPL